MFGCLFILSPSFLSNDLLIEIINRIILNIFIVSDLVELFFPFLNSISKDILRYNHGYNLVIILLNPNTSFAPCTLPLLAHSNLLDTLILPHTLKLADRFQVPTGLHRLGHTLQSLSLTQFQILLAVQFGVQGRFLRFVFCQVFGCQGHAGVYAEMAEEFRV